MKNILNQSCKLFLLLIIVLSVVACTGGNTGVRQIKSAKSADSSVKALYESGLKLMRDKKYTEAINIFDNINMQNDRLPGVHANLGIAWLALENAKKAVVALEQAKLLNASNIDVLNQLGIAYRHNGQFEEAKIVYEQAIAKQSKHTKSHLNLGILCDIYMQNMDCALKHYEVYQSLQAKEDETVALWINDIKSRMGITGEVK